MSNARKKSRKYEIESLVQEGRLAASNNKHRQTCPHFGTSNMVHWMVGYDQRTNELQTADKIL